jgi:mannose-1-phosphate guanylyltransferase/mannose-6-phosphate isomerase
LLFSSLGKVGVDCVARQNLFPVLLCGGSGTRLWPLSRRDEPKQFVIYKEGQSLLRRTYERAKFHPQAKTVVCVGNAAHEFLIRDAVGNSSEGDLLILEPQARNTAASIACAALLLEGADPDAILACMPADHDIGSQQVFHATVSSAIRVAEEGWITILGVVPQEPSSSLGYIAAGAGIGTLGARHVERFIEKPAPEKAAAYLAGGYLWNSGIVIAQAGVLVAALERHVPDVLVACRSALAKATRTGNALKLEECSFLSCPTISFDYAVLEREQKLAVVDFAGQWCDVGNWPEYSRFYPADIEGNRVIGNVKAKSCMDSIVIGSERLSVVLGLREAIVVDTPDALLVADRSRLSELKDVVTELQLAGREEVIHHLKVLRPWGHYRTIFQTKGYSVKNIAVNPGASLSLQYHHHRSEHWVVTKGVGLVTCNDRKFELASNESVYIPCGAVHRLENTGRGVLELIEVQLGEYLAEDDIVRLEDRYGRC